jgi:GAF domain-containing protein
MFDTIFREHRRSRAVTALGILDTPVDPVFDRFVTDAATAFDAPIALLSLIHGDRQWFKAQYGPHIECRERDESFCQFALNRGAVLEVCDPENDPRFAALPVVIAAPYIRYYIGAPLTMMSGVDVGALCVLDVAARLPASADQRAYLTGLARRAAIALEVRSDVLRQGVAP